MCVWKHVNQVVECDGACVDYLESIAAANAARGLAVDAVGRLQELADNAAGATQNTNVAYDMAVKIGRVSVFVEWIDDIMSECSFIELDNVTSRLLATIRNIA